MAKIAKKVESKSSEKMARVPCTHLAGEFFVAAELSRLGYNVAMTMGNAKKVDLIIEWDGVTIPIQVKALAKKENVGWPLNLNHKYDKKLLFILVVLGSHGTQPEYYILTGDVVQERRKDYKNRAILNIANVKDFKSKWMEIESYMLSLKSL